MEEFLKVLPNKYKFDDSFKNVKKSIDKRKLRIYFGCDNFYNNELCENLNDKPVCAIKIYKKYDFLTRDNGIEDIIKICKKTEFDDIICDNTYPAFFEDNVFKDIQKYGSRKQKERIYNLIDKQGLLFRIDDNNDIKWYCKICKNLKEKTDVFYSNQVNILDKINIYDEDYHKFKDRVPNLSDRLINMAIRYRFENDYNEKDDNPYSTLEDHKFLLPLLKLFYIQDEDKRHGIYEKLIKNRFYREATIIYNKKFLSGKSCYIILINIVSDQCIEFKIKCPNLFNNLLEEARNSGGKMGLINRKYKI